MPDWFTSALIQDFTRPSPVTEGSCSQSLSTPSTESVSAAACLPHVVFLSPQDYLSLPAVQTFEKTNGQGIKPMFFPEGVTSYMGGQPAPTSYIIKDFLRGSNFFNGVETTKFLSETLDQKLKTEAATLFKRGKIEGESITELQQFQISLEGIKLLQENFVACQNVNDVEKAILEVINLQKIAKELGISFDQVRKMASHYHQEIGAPLLKILQNFFICREDNLISDFNMLYVPADANTGKPVTAYSFHNITGIGSISGLSGPGSSKVTKYPSTVITKMTLDATSGAFKLDGVIICNEAYLPVLYNGSIDRSNQQVIEVQYRQFETAEKEWMETKRKLDSGAPGVLLRQQFVEEVLFPIAQKNSQKASSFVKQIQQIKDTKSRLMARLDELSKKITDLLLIAQAANLDKDYIDILGKIFKKYTRICNFAEKKYMESPQEYGEDIEIFIDCLAVCCEAIQLQINYDSKYPNDAYYPADDYKARKEWADAAKNLGKNQMILADRFRSRISQLNDKSSTFLQRIKKLFYRIFSRKTESLSTSAGSKETMRQNLLTVWSIGQLANTQRFWSNPNRRSSSLDISVQSSPVVQDRPRAMSV